MTLSRKQKIEKALNLTQKDLQEMPTSELYGYVKALTEEADRRRRVILTSPSMETNPLKKKMEERGKYSAKMPDENEKFMLQRLNSAFTSAYSLVNNPLSTISQWKKERTELRNRFIEKFDPLPDTETGEYSAKAKKLRFQLRQFSHKKIGEFWDLYNKLSEIPEVSRYVAGLDTNTLAQDIFDIVSDRDVNISSLDNRIDYIVKLLTNNDNGILKKQYINRQSDF